MCGRRASTTPCGCWPSTVTRRILAGGQSLMPTLAMRLSQPSVLIDINRLDALKGIHDGDGTVRIGALARHVEVMNSPIVARHLPLIAEAMPHVAHVAVRNRGTSAAASRSPTRPPSCRPASWRSARPWWSRVRAPTIPRRLPWPVRDRAGAGRDPGRGADPRAEDAVSVFMELSRRHGDFALAGLACLARLRAKRWTTSGSSISAAKESPRRQPTPWRRSTARH